MMRRTLVLPAPADVDLDTRHTLDVLDGFLDDYLEAPRDDRAHAVVLFATRDGSIHRWPQGTRDNRPARVLARIHSRLGIPLDDLTAVVLVTGVEW